MRVSPSLLAIMKLCPTKYFYQHICNFVVDDGYDNVDLVYGRTLHKAIELAYVHSYEKGLEVLDGIDVNYGSKTRSSAKALLDTVLSVNQDLEILHVEEPFRFRLGKHVVSGRIDAIVKLNGAIYALDYKTTQEKYLSFKPNDQVASYQLAVKCMYGSSAQGVIIEALDSKRRTVTRHLVSYSDAELDVWQSETKAFLQAFMNYVKTGFYPKNEWACMLYGRPCSYVNFCERGGVL